MKKSMTFVSSWLERSAQDMTIQPSGKPQQVLPFEFILKYFMALISGRCGFGPTPSIRTTTN
jgi:hypothetical protein